MPLVFEVVFFNCCNITDCVYGDGWVRSQRWAKANIQAQKAVLCYQWVTKIGTTYRIAAIRSSLAPLVVFIMPLKGYTGHEMHPRGLTALEIHKLPV